MTAPWPEKEGMARAHHACPSGSIRRLRTPNGSCMCKSVVVESEAVRSSTEMSVLEQGIFFVIEHIVNRTSASLCVTLWPRKTRQVMSAVHPIFNFAFCMQMNKLHSNADQNHQRTPRYARSGPTPYCHIDRVSMVVSQHGQCCPWHTTPSITSTFFLCLSVLLHRLAQLQIAKYLWRTNACARGLHSSDSFGSHN